MNVQWAPPHREEGSSSSSLSRSEEHVFFKRSSRWLFALVRLHWLLPDGNTVGDFSLHFIFFDSEEKLTFEHERRAVIKIVSGEK